MADAQSMTLLILAAGIGQRYGGLKQLEAVGPGGETLLARPAVQRLGLDAGHDVRHKKRHHKDHPPFIHVRPLSGRH